MKSMRSVVLMMIICVVSVCLAGCGEKNNGVQPNNPNLNSGVVDVGDEKENEVIKFENFVEIQEAMPDEVKDFVGVLNTMNLFYADSGDVSGEAYGISPLVLDKKGNESPLLDFMYVLTDMNGDGKDEFLLYDGAAKDEYKNTIVSMYTVKEADDSKELYVILNSSELRVNELCENNVLKTVYPGDEITTTFYYKVNDEFGFDTIDKLEEVRNASGDILYYHASDDVSETKSITVDEAGAIMSKYPLKKVDLLPAIS